MRSASPITMEIWTNSCTNAKKPSCATVSELTPSVVSEDKWDTKESKDINL